LGGVNKFLQRVDDVLHEKDRKRPWLAQESGIKLGTINSWFSQNRYPYVSDASKIAAALGVSIDYLMTGDEPDRRYTDPLIAEMIDYLEGLTPAELQRTYGMLQLARAVTLTGVSVGSERGA
jgi:transcriptional regulator with XRE-family HTH domain